MDSHVPLPPTPGHLKWALTGVANGNWQSRHTVCVEYVCICWDEADVEDRVGVDEREIEVD